MDGAAVGYDPIERKMLITFAQRGAEGRICRFGYLMEARVPCVARMHFLFAPELGTRVFELLFRR